MPFLILFTNSKSADSYSLIRGRIKNLSSSISDGFHSLSSEGFCPLKNFRSSEIFAERRIRGMRKKEDGSSPILFFFHIVLLSVLNTDQAADLCQIFLLNLLQRLLDIQLLGLMSDKDDGCHTSNLPFLHD